MNIASDSTLSKTNKLGSYTEKELRKLYRVLKGKLLNPNGFETYNYKVFLWKISKNINDILKTKTLSN